MALLGSSKLSGYFYAGSLALGLYLLWRFPRRDVVIPPAVQVYLGFYLTFFLLVLVHIAVFSSSLSNIDQVSRIGFGLLNGFFFLALFGFSREKLFDFVVLVAAAHATVAVAVTLYQGIDFWELELTRTRAHGVTNPIPFSGMLLASIGVVAIFLAARVDPRRQWLGLGLLALVMALGLLAVFLTGTRGTLLGFLLLLPLLGVALLGRLDRRLLVVMVALVLAALLPAAIYLFERNPVTWTMVLDFFSGADAASFPRGPTGIRFQLWTHSLALIHDAPLFGHGLGAFPEIFHAPELDLPSNSPLFRFNHVHNQYLDLMLEMGLLGTVLFFGPGAVALVAGARMAADPAERVKGLAMIWVAGAYAVYGLTNVFFAHAAPTLQYGVYLGMLIWLAPDRRRGQADQRPDTVS